VEQLREAISVVSRKRQTPIYIIGFSKGGRAAFQLAKLLDCKAIITIDTSPIPDDPDAVAKEILECSVPAWMIFTRYQKEHTLHRIPKLHDVTPIDNYDVKNLAQAVPPQVGARCKSPLLLDNVATDQRHGTLCTLVTASRAPYNWLLMH
jgi:esterase/lipase